MTVNRHNRILTNEENKKLSDAIKALSLVVESLGGGGIDQLDDNHGMLMLYIGLYRNNDGDIQTHEDEEYLDPYSNF